MQTQTLNVPRAAGFTLVELMVTIVIVAILMTIAVPAYTSQMRKSRRTEAKTALLELAGREERYLSGQSNYTSDLTKFGYPVGAVQTGSGYYTLTLCVDTKLPCAGAAVTGTTFLITATAANVQAADTHCTTLTVDSSGVQSGTSPDCW